MLLRQIINTTYRQQLKHVDYKLGLIKKLTTNLIDKKIQTLLN